MPAPTQAPTPTIAAPADDAVNAPAEPFGKFLLRFYRHPSVVVANPLLKDSREGVTAGVVGLIAITTLTLARSAIPNWQAAVVFAAALLVVYRWKSKFAIPSIMFGAGMVGWLWFN